MTPGRRQEAGRWVLGVHAALDRRAARGEVVLREAERLALRDAHHLAHQIEPRDELGHRVLDLQARVHLEEVEAPVLGEQELERAGAEVADALRALHGDGAHARDELARSGGARRLLDDLLVPALDRAVALEDVHEVALAIAEHLDLDVARPEDRLLEVDRVVAEELLGLAARPLPGARHLVGARDEAHPLAAAARRRLEHHGEADLLRGGDGFVGRLAARAGHDGDARRGHLVARRGLAAHRAHGARGRPDEGDARALARLGQARGSR